jgi:nucleoside triphosphatase
MAEQQYPEPTVGALIFDPASRLFLMKSHKWKDKYCIPGGHIELGERIEDAVKREVKEETNLDVRDLEFVSLQEAVYDEDFWQPRHFIFLDFACRTDATEVKLNDEAEEYVWVTLDEAFTLPVERYTAVTIRTHLKMKDTAGGQDRRAGGDLRETAGENHG